MTSRIHIQNLPIYLTKERLLEHFKKDNNITDCCIVKTKDGKSRRFGFIGLKTIQEAENAVQYYNNTYIDTCRISVQMAKNRNGDNLDRPWSKYSKGSSRYKTKEIEVNNKNNNDTTTGNNNKNNNINNKEFQEFMDVMQPRSQSKFWANDDAINPNASKEVERNTGKLNKYKNKEEEIIINNEDKNIETDNEMEMDHEEIDYKNKLNKMSDLEFMRSKMLTNLKDDDDDDSDDSDENDNRNEKSNEDNVSTTTDNKLENINEKENIEINKGRLFVRNLSYLCTEEDIIEHFSPFGEIEEVHMPLDEMKKKKGFCFIQYKDSKSAQKAMIKLDNHAFQGRLLHIIYAKNRPKRIEEIKMEGKNMTHKEKKEIERKKLAENKIGWNTSYIHSNTAMEALASRYNMEKRDFIDKDKDNMALKMTIGETILLKENREFLKENGINFESFETNTNKNNKIKRSIHTILVKNLPFAADKFELEKLFSKYGEIKKCIFPPSKTLLLIEFIEPTDAKKAFRSLAYKRYQHLPLYLEWAPIDIFTSSVNNNNTNSNNNKDTSSPEFKSNNNINHNDTKSVKLDEILPDVTNDENLIENNYTVCVKNLNFDTKEADLETLFKQIGGIRKITIAKKKNMKKNADKIPYLSMGFGFIEFSSSSYATKAIKLYNNIKLHGHALELKLSNKKLSINKIKSFHSNEISTKIIVRNVAFEANKTELRELFSTFGQLKHIRIPKKFNGEKRGFVFVEYLTEKDAKNAFQSLSSTHFYGRHLVLEWAEKDKDLDSLREKAAKDIHLLTNEILNERNKKRKVTNDSDFIDNNEFNY